MVTMTNNMIITDDVQKRFFTAIEYFTETKKLAGLQTFCRDYKLNRPRYSRVKNKVMSPETSAETMYRTIDIVALVIICRDFNISSDWLLLGKGKMFR